nr:hypothetical protein [Tanacetum cinerariifolium]
MEPVASQPFNLADKIQNIEGKNIKEGRLSAALRGVFPAGLYVHVMQSKEASKIFGAPENPVDEGNSNVPNVNKVSQHAVAKPTAYTYSFANVLNRSSQPNKKIVKLHELRNSKMVEGVAVVIPIEVVE